MVPGATETASLHRANATAADGSRAVAQDAATAAFAASQPWTIAPNRNGL